jgi:hypothetical protein
MSNSKASFAPHISVEKSKVRFDPKADSQIGADMMSWTGALLEASNMIVIFPNGRVGAKRASA